MKIFFRINDVTSLLPTASDDRCIDPELLNGFSELRIVQPVKEMKSIAEESSIC